MGTVTSLPRDMRVTEDDFGEYMRETDTKVKVIGAEEYTDDLDLLMFGNVKAHDSVLPWNRTHKNVQFRKGEVTLWPGINGHRKSMVVGQVAISLCAQGERVLLASFEMKPTQSLERMTRQAAGCNPSQQFMHEFVGSWLRGRMWFYDQQGTVAQKQLVAVIKYAADKLGCTHIVIDNLAKCVKGSDDYNAQKDFVDLLTSLARDYRIHVHLVHHVRKGQDESMPNKSDAKGAGEIMDQVDNCIIVWKNKERERVRQKVEDGQALTAKEAELMESPDQMLSVEKQRNGPWEGRIALWFDPVSLQLLPSSNMVRMDLMRDPRL